MLTANFTEAADALMQDPNIPDDILHTRAIHYLDALIESNPAQLNGPSWAERIQKVVPQVPAFSTLRLFQALFYVADELGLASGKRYVSATICACGDRVTPAAVGDAPDSNLVQALDVVSSTWAAFVLWPFYAYGTDDDLNSAPIPNLRFWETPTDSEWLAIHQRDRDQQRHWKEQVMARDNYYCFMCGCYDTDWFFRQQPAPEGADFDDCNVVPIIKREVLVNVGESESPNIHMDITRGLLKRYFGVDETVLEKAEGPQNTLFVNKSSCFEFRRFRWCLHPTETPNCYKIQRLGLRSCGSRHITSHVTFVDHSQSYAHLRAQAQAGTNVDLPDRALLRLHAALAGVLWRSGAIASFDRLFFRPAWLPGYPRWPAPSGEAFWRSVVGYEGEETCLEVDLHLSTEALRDGMREHALAG